MARSSIRVRVCICNPCYSPFPGFHHQQVIKVDLYIRAHTPWSSTAFVSTTTKLTMASQDHHTVASTGTHFDSEEKLRYELAKTVTLTPELYERLFISPKTPVAGDLRARFGNPTPIGVLGFSVGVIPLAISFSRLQ